jgi:hypothetical protein
MTKKKATVRLKVRDAGDGVEYEAVVKRGGGEKIEISGSTYCDTKECIKQIVKRALTGQKELPDSIEKAAKHLIDYVITTIKTFHVDDASASLVKGVGPIYIEAEVGMLIRLYYLDGGEDEDEEEYVGWYAVVKTWFSGCDGVAAVDGYHQFKKEVTLGRHLDDDAVKRLTDELIKLAKLAYNVLPGPCISMTYSSTCLTTSHGVVKSDHSHPSQSSFATSARMRASANGLTLILKPPGLSPVSALESSTDISSSSNHKPYGSTTAFVTPFRRKLCSAYLWKTGSYAYTRSAPLLTKSTAVSPRYAPTSATVLPSTSRTSYTPSKSSKNRRNIPSRGAAKVPSLLRKYTNSPSAQTSPMLASLRNMRNVAASLTVMPLYV